MLVRNMKKLTFAIIPFICSLLCLTVWAQQAEQPAYKNSQLPVEQRVGDLISRMTLQEKVSQLGHTADAIPRLGVPQYDWWNEGLHGVARAGTATVFPQAIGMAAMFDETLLHQIADVISTEFRAKYVERVHPDGSTDWYRGLTVWSPNINIFRDPRWGRGQETYGEDPYLTSRLGLAFVTGLQGDDPTYLKTVSTPRHFAVHSRPETTLHTVEVIASQHDMEDSYLPAIRDTVMDAKAEEVMRAFNSLNARPAFGQLFSARSRLGLFDPPGMVTWSKITAAENDTEEHRQIALKAARESLVLLKNQNNFLPLKKTYKNIAVLGPNADSVDALVGNYNGTPSKPVTLLAGIKKRFEGSTVAYVEGTGLTGPATDGIPAEALFTGVNRREHGLRAEYYSNPKLEGTPTMSRTDANVNFEWAYSGVTPELVRNFSVRWAGVVVPPKTGDYLIGFTGEDGYRVWLDGNLIVEDWTRHRTAQNQTKQLHLEAGHAYPIKIEYFQLIRGSEARLIWGLLGKAQQDAVDAARRADLVVMAMGLSPRIEGEEMKVDAEGLAGGDRTTIDLPAPQQKLLERVYAMGKPVVLVLMGGSAIAVNWADEKLPAIVDAWYSGEEGGTAIAEMLAGDFSPRGRLPVTFYKSVDQLPAFEDYAMAKRTYRYFAGEALYPFGYGLTYTSFTYMNAKVNQPSVPADGSVSVTVDVSNSGRLAGDEVVQLYLAHPGVPGAPLRALQGFQRVHLEPGQTKTVRFDLTNRQLGVVDEAGTHRILPGKVQVWIGGGQPVSRAGLGRTGGAETQFTITGESTLPE